jgi:hypothetical protein
MLPLEYRESPTYSGYLVRSDGSVIGRSGKVLKPCPDGAGYSKLVMCLPGNKRKTIRVHVLVCETFHGPRPFGHAVAHADGDRSNNRADNLRWATYTENEADKRAHGTAARGERQGLSQLTADKVREIRTRAAAGETQRSLAHAFGVCKASIQTAISGKTWGHVA